MANRKSLVPFTFPASATTGASFNVPHGAAPTSPVNGDVWTTTAGIYVRINGATVGPLGAGGGGGGDAYLANNQTFTGLNVFDNTPGTSTTNVVDVYARTDATNGTQFKVRPVGGSIITTNSTATRVNKIQTLATYAEMSGSDSAGATSSSIRSLASGAVEITSNGTETFSIELSAVTGMTFYVPSMGATFDVAAGGDVHVGDIVLKGSGTNGIELGRTDGAASTPFIDFHTSSTGTNDYDVRLLASGDSIYPGGGALVLYAASGLFTDGPVSAGGALSAHSVTVSSPSGASTVTVNGSSFSSIGASRYSTDAGPPQAILFKARGTSSAPTLVASGDVAGQIDFMAYDGASILDTAVIKAEIDGTPGTNDMPGRLIFATTADGNSGASERMRITNSGNVGIGSVPPSTGARAVITGVSTAPVPTLGTPSGTLLLTNSDTSYGLMIGSAASGDSWMQVQRVDTGATAYNLLLQPSGGAVTVGGALTASNTNNNAITLTCANGIGDTSSLQLNSTEVRLSGVNRPVGIYASAATVDAPTATFTGTIICPTGTTALAPAKIPSGTLLTSIVAGAVETNAAGLLHITPSTTAGRARVRAAQMVVSQANSTAATTNTLQNCFASANDVLSSLKAATTYKFKATYFVTATFTSGTPNLQVAFTFSNAPAAIKYTFKTMTTTAGTAFNRLGMVTSAAATQVTAAISATTTFAVEIEGMINTHATLTSTLTPQFQMSTTGVSSVVGALSSFEIEELAGSSATLIAGNWA
jgi:hypothetical protein